MKTFVMVRNGDESGVSGTGPVLEGAVFSDGVTVIRWTVKDKPNSTAVYDSFEAFKFLHIDSHPTNGTEIVWFQDDHYLGIDPAVPGAERTFINGEECISEKPLAQGGIIANPDSLAGGGVNEGREAIIPLDRIGPFKINIDMNNSIITEENLEKLEKRLKEKLGDE